MNNDIDALIHRKGKDYGEPDVFMRQLADVWSTMLGVTLEPNQVVAMMVAFKTIRACNNPSHADSFVDICGYGRIGCNLSKNNNE